MPGTTDTVKAILTPGEFVIRKEAVDMIGVPTLEKLNDMPEAGGHSEIDRLIAQATLKNMTGMYGGGEVKTQQYGHGGQVQGYEDGGSVLDMALRRAEPMQLNPEFVNVDYELEDSYDKYSRVNRLRPFLENQLKYTDEANIYRKALEPFNKARYEGLGEPVSAIEEWSKKVNPEGDFNEGSDVDKELYKKLKKADAKLQRSALTSNRQMGQMIYQANRDKPIIGNFDQPLKDYTKASKEFEGLLREIIRRPIASKALDESFNIKKYNLRQKGNPFYGDYDTSATGERYDMQNPKRFLDYRDQPVLDVFEDGGLIGMMHGGKAKKKKEMYGYQEGGNVLSNLLSKLSGANKRQKAYEELVPKTDNVYKPLRALNYRLPFESELSGMSEDEIALYFQNKEAEQLMRKIDYVDVEGYASPSFRKYYRQDDEGRPATREGQVDVSGYQEGGAVQENAMMQQYLQSLMAQQPQANPFVPFDQRPPSSGEVMSSIPSGMQQGDYYRSLRGELEMENEELIRDKAQNALERIKLDSLLMQMAEQDKVDSLLREGAERIESLPDTSRFMPTSPFNLGIEI